MKNIEIKARLDDRTRVERQLAALGARRMWVRRQRDTFFSVPQRRTTVPDGPLTDGGAGWLKLREVDGRRAELISYSRSSSSVPRVSDYDVVTVDDPATWKRLLTRALGEDRVVEKERTLWLYENTRVHLDRVEGLGDYVELETVIQRQTEAEARAETRRLMEVLHIQEPACIERPYRDLLS